MDFSKDLDGIYNLSPICNIKVDYKNPAMIDE